MELDKMKKINDRIIYLEEQLLIEKDIYWKLNQVDKLRMQGTIIKDKIANFEGQIEALKWIIHK